MKLKANKILIMLALRQKTFNSDNANDDWCIRIYVQIKPTYELEHSKDHSLHRSRAAVF